MSTQEVIPAPSVADQALSGIRHAKKRAFLAAYCVTGTVTAAAQAAGIDRTSHYIWMARDERYAVAFKAAHEISLDVLEAEARRRAIEGVAEPYLHGGAMVMDPDTGKPLVKRTYSDTLLIFLLNGGRPEKYRYRGTIEHSGPGGGPIPVSVEHRLAASITELRDVIDTTGRELAAPSEEDG